MHGIMQLCETLFFLSSL